MWMCVHYHLFTFWILPHWAIYIFGFLPIYNLVFSLLLAWERYPQKNPSIYIILNMHVHGENVLSLLERPYLWFLEIGFEIAPNSRHDMYHRP